MPRRANRHALAPNSAWERDELRAGHRKVPDVESHYRAADAAPLAFAYFFFASAICGVGDI